MHLLPLSLLSLCLATTSSTSSTPKRGLIYIGRGTRESPGDDIYWAARNTSLTWYYNYSFYSTRTLQQNPSLEYVPMLWGAPAASAAGDFGRTIRQYKSSGMNINYVLGFNEPDHPKDGGGSDIPLADAVRIWKTEMEPVRSLGIKLGSPATVGNAGGIAWLQNFIRMCDGCHFDFIPLHYYGGFEGMLSYIAQARMAFANVTSEFWLTEFALPAAPLEATQRDFNQSLAYLDNANNSGITRYSYFGSLRTNAAPAFTGPNVAFVNQNGQLTEMGQIYLGSSFTKYSPNGGTGVASRSYSSRLGSWCAVCVTLLTIL